MSEAENHTTRAPESRPPRTLDEILQSSEGLRFTEPNALPMPEQSAKPRRGFHATPVALDDELPKPVHRSAVTKVRQDIDWGLIGKVVAIGALQLVAIVGAYLVWKHSKVAQPQVPYRSTNDPSVYVLRTSTPVYVLWNLATIVVMAVPTLLLSAWDQLRQREWIGMAAAISTLTAVAVAFARFSGH